VGKDRMGINIGRVDLKGTSPSASSEARSIQATDPQQFASFRYMRWQGSLKRNAIIARGKTKSQRKLKRPVLRSKRIPYEGITKGQASELINTIYNAATEGQVRRLAFYGIDFEGQRRRKRVSLSMTTSQVIRMQRTIISDGR